MNNQTSALTRGGFPLVAIFLLTAVVAVLGSQISLIIAMKKNVSVDFPFSIAVGGATGLSLGLLIGLFHIRRLRGAMIGLLAGLVTGGMAGPACMAAIEQPWPILFTSLAGGAGLMVIAILYRLINDRDPVGRSGDSLVVADLHPLTHGDQSSNSNE